MRHQIIQPVRGVPLSVEGCRAVYDMLRVHQPFKRWKLPPGSEVGFRLARRDDVRGEYSAYNTGEHEIMVSTICVKHMDTLVRTMAHEMCHLAARIARTEHHKNLHNADWHRRAKQVCEVYGWDYGIF
jgi:hypothetical protein